MSNTKTKYFMTVVSSLSADEFPLMLVTINHPNLSSPVRIVNDNSDVVSNGNTFTRSSFQLAPPNDPSTGLATTSLSIANVGNRVIPDFIDTAKGQGVTIQTEIILRSQPDMVEYSATFAVKEFTITLQNITAKLQAPNYFNKAWTSIFYDSKTAPALT